MNLLDVVLLLCCLVYGLTGYQQGFLVGAGSTVGLVAGGVVGIEVVPLVLGGFSAGVGVSVAAIAVVLALAFIGQAIGGYAGHWLRRRVTWRPARLVDAMSGAALSVAAMLVIAWVLGVAASGAQLDGVTREVSTSRVLAAVDAVMPGDPDRLLGAFDSVVGSTGFPRYLEPFEPERITPVPPASRQVLHTSGVQAAARSVVKILGDAPSCSKTLEGSGFVYAPHRVMTNAHVVAGVTHPVVRLDDTDHAATIVFYDPDVDVAVLAVPDLTAPVLRFGPAVDTGAPAAVLGYPEDGPYTATPARVRSAERLRSPNIYGDGSVTRDAYAVEAHVHQGNSGGPLVSPAGRVLGIVFAASLIDSDTGYALSAGQVESAAQAGIRAHSAVSTGGCAR